MGVELNENNYKKNNFNQFSCCQPVTSALCMYHGSVPDTLVLLSKPADNYKLETTTTKKNQLSPKSSTCSNLGEG